MSRELSFHRGARQELREAARWYEARGAALGAEFVGEIASCLARIAERPGVFPEVRGAPGVRRAVIRRFPYAVVFLIHDDVIMVLAVAHGRRHPLVLENAGGAVKSPLNALDVVALLVDDREHGLIRGQVGTIVEQLDHGVFEVDFCDDEGRSYADVAVSARALLRLHYCRLERDSTTE